MKLLGIHKIDWTVAVILLTFPSDKLFHVLANIPVETRSVKEKKIW